MSVPQPVPKEWLVDFMAAYKFFYGHVFSFDSDVEAAAERLGVSRDEVEARWRELQNPASTGSGPDNAPNKMPGLPELYELGQFAGADHGSAGFEAAFETALRHLARFFFSQPLSQFLLRNVAVMSSRPEIDAALRSLARGPHHALQTLAKVLEVSDREGRSIPMSTEVGAVLLRRLPGATRNEAIHILLALIGHSYGTFAYDFSGSDDRALLTRALAHNEPEVRMLSAIALLQMGGSVPSEASLRDLAHTLVAAMGLDFFNLHYIFRENEKGARLLLPFFAEILRDHGQAEDARLNAFERLMSYGAGEDSYGEDAWNYYQGLSQEDRGQVEKRFFSLPQDSPLRHFLAARGYTFPVPPVDRSEVGNQHPSCGRGRSCGGGNSTERVSTRRRAASSLRTLRKIEHLFVF